MLPAGKRDPEANLEISPVVRDTMDSSTSQSDIVALQQAAHNFVILVNLNHFLVDYPRLYFFYTGNKNLPIFATFCHFSNFKWKSLRL